MNSHVIAAMIFDQINNGLSLFNQLSSRETRKAPVGVSVSEGLLVRNLGLHLGNYSLQVLLYCC